MPDCTYLNNVPANRIHKSNAGEVAEEANKMLEWYKIRLLLMAATNPCPQEEGEPWHEYVTREVPQIVEEMLEEAHRAWLASYIRDHPDSCADELEPKD